MGTGLMSMGVSKAIAAAGGGGLAIDDDSQSTVTESGTTISWTSHTIAGTDRLLVVCVSWVHHAFETNISSVTYGAAGLTSAGAAANQNDGFSFVKSQIWYLIAPNTGTATITVTFDDTSYGMAGAISFTGADQTTPLVNLATANGTSTTATVNVSSASGDMVVDAATCYTVPVMTVGASQTGFYAGNSTDNVEGAGSTEAGGATITMSWGLGESQRWATSGVSVQAA